MSLFFLSVAFFCHAHHRRSLAILQGKDRYPYPIGYQVIRALNGSTYKMEIHEGLKGPLFVVCTQTQLFLILTLTSVGLQHILRLLINV